MATVAILGGGISGLSAAYYLSRPAAGFIKKVKMHKKHGYVTFYCSSTSCSHSQSLYQLLEHWPMISIPPSPV